jgi:hypothetical protein
MATQANHSPAHDEAAGAGTVVSERRREEARLNTGAVQNAIFNSANFSSISRELLVTIRDGLERGRMTAATCRNTRL